MFKGRSDKGKNVKNYGMLHLLPKPFVRISMFLSSQMILTTAASEQEFQTSRKKSSGGRARRFTSAESSRGSIVDLSRALIAISRLFHPCTNWIKSTTRNHRFISVCTTTGMQVIHLDRYCGTQGVTKAESVNAFCLSPSDDSVLVWPSMIHSEANAWTLFSRFRDRWIDVSANLRQSAPRHALRSLPEYEATINFRWRVGVMNFHKFSTKDVNHFAILKNRKTKICL